MKILNYGSLNIDYVYHVDHIVTPGETLGSRSLTTFAGGKGANQSVALARAGAHVAHAGRIGRDGEWLAAKLAASKVDTEFIRIGDGPSGHAIIQVDAKGQNSIVLFAGENRKITHDEIGETLTQFDPGDILLLQNEINAIPYIMETAAACGLSICLNPAPMDDEVRNYPLDLVSLLIVNETEGAALSGFREQPRILDALQKLYPKTEIILTLGKDGAVFRGKSVELRVPGVPVKAVDTTAAGDTFIGYFLAARARGDAVEPCLRLACAAAALSVTRPGAMDSIPTAAEVTPGND